LATEETLHPLPPDSRQTVIKNGQGSRRAVVYAFTPRPDSVDLRSPAAALPPFAHTLLENIQDYSPCRTVTGALAVNTRISTTNAFSARVRVGGEGRIRTASELSQPVSYTIKVPAVANKTSIAGAYRPISPDDYGCSVTAFLSFLGSEARSIRRDSGASGDTELRQDYISLKLVTVRAAPVLSAYTGTSAKGGLSNNCMKVCLEGSPSIWASAGAEDRCDYPDIATSGCLLAPARLWSTFGSALWLRLRRLPKKKQ
jgi:hypothetical protein